MSSAANAPADVLAATPHLTVPFVDVQAAYRLMKADIDAAIQRVIDRSDFILGAAVAEFEEIFARYCGVAHAVGVDSGFSALELTLRAHDIGPGAEVITAANTFVATVGAIEAVAARPVLVDVLPDTYTLDPDAVRAAITPATRALIPVHLYGQPADMGAISALASEHGLWVFEDACQAHGARYEGRRAGRLGHAAAFSFYPSKNLGAFGDGGMVVTGDADIAGRLRALRDLGKSTKHRHDSKGFNRRLDTLQAAILSVKAARLDDDNRSRQDTAARYARAFEDLALVTPRTAPNRQHVFHLYVVEAVQRDALQAHLSTAGVGTGIHYPIPVHLQRAYRSLGRGHGSFPVTERAARRILSLPMYPGMPPAAFAHTTGAIRDFFRA